MEPRGALGLAEGVEEGDHEGDREGHKEDDAPDRNAVLWGDEEWHGEQASF